jgi:serine/threonine-protein kinase RsbT
VAAPHHVGVRSQADAERAQRTVRALAREVGLDVQDTEALVLATLELANNLVRYGTHGEMTFIAVDGPRGAGVQVESLDRGPGISDLDRALTDGFSTGGGLGVGLPGVRRLMDEFDIASTSDGTRVLARKWPRRRSS